MFASQKYKRTCIAVLKVLSHNAIKMFLSCALKECSFAAVKVYKNVHLQLLHCMLSMLYAHFLCKKCQSKLKITKLEKSHLKISPKEIICIFYAGHSFHAY